MLFTSSVFEGRAPLDERNMTVFHGQCEQERIEEELDQILGKHPREILHSYSGQAPFLSLTLASTVEK